MVFVCFDRRGTTTSLAPQIRHRRYIIGETVKYPGQIILCKPKHRLGARWGAELAVARSNCPLIASAEPPPRAAGEASTADSMSQQPCPSKRGDGSRAAPTNGNLHQQLCLAIEKAANWDRLQFASSHDQASASRLPSAMTQTSFVPTTSEPGTGLVTFLGTGTSVGVPTIGCNCSVCQGGHPKNQRTRCAITVRLPAGTLLIDTPPDLRTQLLRERIGLIHAVVFTHEHADHIFGLDDLRLFPFRLEHAVPLFCTEVVEEVIRRAYAYAFSEREDTHPGATPKLQFQRIDPQPFEVLQTQLTPIPMKHGPHFEVFGFRIGDFAYCTDGNGFSDESIDRLRGVQTLVLGALREEPHPTHMSVDQAIEIAQQVGAPRTLLTHTSHKLDYDETMQRLPAGIEMAFDGQQVEISL
ncbi:Phosphoribosyl 1,2-cyclic phosphodiesterase [Stieleria bergensis]|uniref:Phosphoribosyl 1,2-cyclic phosphodiesterase n=1 Tax=Stieleria bergensis TaxID=2528025 RepID=A0A517SSB2_9BACT|nr:Phosphoribosyl 1,2-cyclic phosphodiesterase [Planctomycetes bacterium SV_7m_r]